jgi:hypothetical protein
VRVVRTGLVLCLLALPSPATAAPRPFLFPVVGGATYTDDYGDARPQGRHEGNDLMAARGTPVVAVDAGVVTLQHSGRGGWMIYLRNRFHEWLYVHLSDDVHGDDNRGGRRTAYAKGLKSGMRVIAGQEIGYVGNSGDAAGGPTHLHFEEHTAAGRPHDPYHHLRSAPIPLLSAVAPAPRQRPNLSIELTGTLAWYADTDTGARIALRVSSLTASGRTRAVSRLVVLAIDPALADGAAAIDPGTAVRVTTTERAVTVQAQLLRAATFQVASVDTIG